MSTLQPFEIGDFLMNVATFSAAALLLTTRGFGYAQDISGPRTPVSELIAEAERNNSQILAAEHTWRAATHVRQQVTTLPDPEFTIQQFSVGSPRPFAGFTNSDFAYIGFGTSQTLPYPGKLRLKGEMAEREADRKHAQADALRASVAEEVKTDYFHLAYLQQTLTLLERSGATLNQLADSELSRYRAGQGSQADVLRAQLEHTRLVRDITAHHKEMAQVQADLKLLLHRPQEAPGIIAENLTATTLQYAAPELLASVREHNPAVRTETIALEKQNAALQSAKRGSKPDFSIGYMFEETGDHYRNYYMLTFNVSLPRRRRVNAELAETAELLNHTREQLDAELQQQLADVQKQYIAANAAAQLTKEYREGLIPQAEAAFQANLSAYQSNAQQLNSVLLALNELLNLQREYAEALLEHEIAVARLETLTGVTLR
jgi:cobalt-zinc-cadmium efflux system outer membrane protein